MALNMPLLESKRAKATRTTLSNPGEVRLSAFSSNPMKQIAFADAECTSKHKQTRNESFLIEVIHIVPWMGLIALIGHITPRVRVVARGGAHD